MDKATRWDISAQKNTTTMNITDLERLKQAGKKTELTKGEIRATAIKILTLRGCKIWIQNQIPTLKRKFIGEKGQADLIGYVRNTGIFVACEVKTKNDKLSQEQIIFLTELKKAGGISLLATDNNGQVELKEFQPMIAVKVDEVTAAIIENLIK